MATVQSAPLERAALSDHQRDRPPASANWLTPFPLPGARPAARRPRQTPARRMKTRRMPRKPLWRRLQSQSRTRLSNPPPARSRRMRRRARPGTGWRGGAQKRGRKKGMRVGNWRSRPLDQRSKTPSPSGRWSSAGAMICQSWTCSPLQLSRRRRRQRQGSLFQSRSCPSSSVVLRESVVQKAACRLARRRYLTASSSSRAAIMPSSSGWRAVTMRSKPAARSTAAASSEMAT